MHFTNCFPFLIRGFSNNLDTISFEIYNQYDKAIEVEFINYVVTGQQPTDTIFTVLSGKKVLVYFDAGRVLPKEQYIVSDTVKFCKSIKLSSENLISPKNFLLAGEWEYERKDNQTEV